MVTLYVSVMKSMKIRKSASTSGVKNNKKVNKLFGITHFTNREICLPLHFLGSVDQSTPTYKPLITCLINTRLTSFFKLLVDTAVIIIDIPAFVHIILKKDLYIFRQKTQIR